MPLTVQTPQPHVTLSGFGGLTNLRDTGFTFNDAANHAENMRSLIIALENPQPKRIHAIDYSVSSITTDAGVTAVPFRVVTRISVIRNFSLEQAQRVAVYDPWFTEKTNGVRNANSVGNDWGKFFNWNEYDVIYTMFTHHDECRTAILDLDLPIEPCCIIMTPAYSGLDFRTVVNGTPDSGYQAVATYIGTPGASSQNTRQYAFRALNVIGNYC